MSKDFDLEGLRAVESVAAMVRAWHYPREAVRRPWRRAKRHVRDYWRRVGRVILAGCVAARVWSEP